MRQCRECGKYLKEEDFSLKLGVRRGTCKPCKREYNKAWYKNNKGKHLKNVKKNNKKYVRKQKEYVNKLKDVPCADCKQSFPACVMQFDHIPTKGKKLFCISRGVAKVSLECLIKEIEKCEVICANCHTIRTHDRRVCSSTG